MSAPPPPPAPALALPFLARSPTSAWPDSCSRPLVLGASYLVAYLVTLIVGRLLMARARRTSTDRDAVSRPLAAPAPGRRPLPARRGGGGRALAPARVRGCCGSPACVFAGAVVAATVALVRSWRLVLYWWATDATSGEEKPWARDFSPLLTKVGGVLIGLVGLITVLQGFGVDVNSLVVSLGVGSLAVGLAAQDTLANMFAGFTLMLDRPFRVGRAHPARERGGGRRGRPSACAPPGCGPRDETLLVIPNSLLTKEKVVNLSHPSRALTTRLEVAVAYGSDLAQVKEILRGGGVHLHADRAEPGAGRAPGAPRRLLGKLPPGVLGERLRRAGRRPRARSTRRSTARLAEAGIEIPYPVRRVIHGRAGRRPAPS